MTQIPLSPNTSPNPDPQGDGVSRDDITAFQGQLHIPERPPKSLLDWLVRVHLRLMALEDEQKITS
jgi:hypothetical protein